MKSAIVVTVCICFTVIVVSSIAALAFIAVGHDGTIVPQIVSALGSIITAFTLVAGFLGRDVVQNVIPVMGKSVSTSTTVSSTPPATPAPEPTNGGTGV